MVQVMPQMVANVYEGRVNHPPTQHEFAASYTTPVPSSSKQLHLSAETLCQSSRAEDGSRDVKLKLRCSRVISVVGDKVYLK